MSDYCKQRSALAFCALSVPSVMLLAKVGWLWAGAAAIAVAVLSGLIRKKRFPTVMIIWNFIALGAATDMLCGAFEQGNELIGLLLLLLASYAASRQVMLRAGAVAAFFLIIIYCMLLGFSLPSVTQLRPQTDVPWYLLAGALTPMLFAEEGVPKWSLAAFVVLTVLSAIIASGGDFLAAMKSVTILNVMQRLEPFASVAMLIGGFCLLGTICDINRRLLGSAEKYSAAINFLLGSVGIWISRLIGGPFLAIGTAIFWGLLPFLPQSLEIQKKFEKNQKKA